MDWTRVLDRPALERLHAVQSPAHAHDFVGLPADPVEDQLTALANDGEGPDARRELWLGSAGGVPVAAGSITVPRLDNLDTAEIGLCVKPAARGRGHGAAAVDLLLLRCRELDRTRITTQVSHGLDGTPSAGDRLAARCGFASKFGEVRRLLDLSTAGDWSGLAGAVPAGYTVTTWVDRAPASVVPGLAALEARMSIDAPRGDLGFEPERWDAARWMVREDDALARGRLHVGAHVTVGDEVVGYTDLGVPRSQPEVGFQWTTIVRADHRGHRLGLLLKIASYRRLRAESPATRWVTTWNAADNAHMIAINEAMGFRAVDAWSGWQRTL